MHTTAIDPLSAWLFPKVRMAVLSHLLLDKREWHARELSRVTGLNHAAIGKELQGMQEAGIAIRRRSGNRVYYSANPECPVHQELLMLVTKTAGLADQIRHALAPLSDRISLAYIYGSMATGTGRAHSDIDLMVVGDADLLEVIEALNSLEDDTRRKTNPLTFTDSEYRTELASGRGFVSTVHEREKILLIGELNEFEYNDHQR